MALLGVIFMHHSGVRSVYAILSALGEVRN